MDDNRIAGAVKEGVGRVQGALGRSFDDEGLENRGRLNAATGAARNAYGQAVDTVRNLLDDAADQIEARPYAAAGVGALLGILVGLLIATRLD